MTHESETLSRGGLENTSDDENSTSRDDGPSSTKVIGQITSNQSTEESTGGQDGGDQRLLPSWEGELLGRGSGGIKTSVESNKVFIFGSVM